MAIDLGVRRKGTQDRSSGRDRGLPLRGGAMTTIAVAVPPGDILKEELEARGWSQVEFAEILGMSPRLVSEIISAKRAITPATARAIGGAFGTTAQVWLNLEAAYQLDKTRHDDTVVSRRARLYRLGPIKEMARRHWLQVSNDIE